MIKLENEVNQLYEYCQDGCGGSFGDLLAAAKRKEEKKRNRMYWVQTILTDRSEKGLFVTLYSDLRANPDRLNVFLFARMSISFFDELMPNPTYANLPNSRSNLNLVNNFFKINFYDISIHDY